MKGIINILLKKTSIFILIGVFLILISASSGITIGNFSIKISDLAGRITLGVISIALIILGIYLELRMSITPKISSLKIKSTHIISDELDPKRMITAKNKRSIPIKSEFIDKEQCTIMIWVKVPALGEGLRHKKQNKYIIAHTTGSANGDGKRPYNNRFSLGFKNGDQWVIDISNNNAKKENEKRIVIKDGLHTGWHHFMIAWDRSSQVVEFMIDGGLNGKELAGKDFFSYWPVQLAEKVVIGRWTSNDQCFYCDTELYKLVIYDKYLSTRTEEYKAHIKMKPEH